MAYLASAIVRTAKWIRTGDVNMRWMGLAAALIMLTACESHTKDADSAKSGSAVSAAAFDVAAQTQQAHGPQRASTLLDSCAATAAKFKSEWPNQIFNWSSENQEFWEDINREYVFYKMLNQSCKEMPGAEPSEIIADAGKWAFHFTKWKIVPEIQEIERLRNHMRGQQQAQPISGNEQISGTDENQPWLYYQRMQESGNYPAPEAPAVAVVKPYAPVRSYSYGTSSYGSESDVVSSKQRNIRYDSSEPGDIESEPLVTTAYNTQTPSQTTYVDSKGTQEFGAIPAGPNAYWDGDGQYHQTFDRGDVTQQAFRKPIDAYNEMGAAFEQN